MEKSFWLLFFIGFLAFTDARYFRNDYIYNVDLGGWLKFHEMPSTWDEARLRCFFEGSVFASPLDEGLKAAMVSAIDNRTEYVFTGISATISKGDYFSIEGVALTNIPHTWSKKQPDNTGDEACISMTRNGLLGDISCKKPLPYICYKRNSEDMPSANQCGTVDSDYTFETRTGHCYKFHRFGQTWSRAFMACAAEGGYLAVINSDVEAQVIKELIAKYPSAKVVAKHKDIISIGFHDWSEHGVFTTIQGQTLKDAGYEKWAANQPDNQTTGEFCGSVFRDSLLNDVWCGVTLPFICEKSPGSLLDNGSGSTEEIEIDARNQ